MSEALQITAPVSWAARCDADSISDRIARIISRTGHQRLAVPGGRTPLPIFELLSKCSLPWGTVSLMLTDDRIVPKKHPSSNQGKLAAAFDATAAEILPLEQGASVEPFSLVWLGMGNDGHIASLFPKMISDVCDDPRVIRTFPQPLPLDAPFERLSLNMSALTATEEMMIVIRGTDKKLVLEDALAGKNNLPIAQLLRQLTCPLTIYRSAA